MGRTAEFFLLATECSASHRPSAGSLGHYYNKKDLNFTAAPLELPFTLPSSYPADRRVAAFMMVVINLEGHTVGRDKDIGGRD